MLARNEKVRQSPDTVLSKKKREREKANINAYALVKNMPINGQTTLAV
jgi:hypothetical protein